MSMYSPEPDYDLEYAMAIRKSEQEHESRLSTITILMQNLAALKAQHVEALAVEYGDGYCAGMVDGIRDLRGAIKLAIAQEDISQRLPAVERVLAEYEAMYLKGETK